MDKIHGTAWWVSYAFDCIGASSFSTDTTPLDKRYNATKIQPLMVPKRENQGAELAGVQD